MVIVTGTNLLEEHACDAAQKCTSAPAISEECCQEMVTGRKSVNIYELVMYLEHISCGL